MRVTLRPMQTILRAAILAAWAAGNSCVLAVAPTGSGKTVSFSDIILDEPGAVCAIAHRHELVGQISLALARNGIRHRIIGSKELRAECSAGHLEELGYDYIDANSRVAAASVDTLIGMNPADPWFRTVALWVMDEAHHAQRENKWGRAVAMFPRARGLGVTAETERADGGGLGAWNDGVFHTIVEAPGMREHINGGYLTDYRIFVPPNTLDLSVVPITASGEFSPKKLAVETKRAGITGNVVEHYIKIASGKLGISFCVDIEDATVTAQAYRDAGVPAEVVSSKTPSALRRSILRRFKRREIMQLVNVDLFGEGFDLPAIEVVSMARATQSYQLYKQQFGRALRLLAGKPFGIIIDHVGNVIRHGLPDKPRAQTLERREKKSKSKVDEDVIPLTVCVECVMPYERIYSSCPWCGHCKPPSGRGAPEFVDGDLTELTADVLAKMRGEVAKVDSSWHIGGEPPSNPREYSMRGNQASRQAAQAGLRDTLSLWAGWQKSLGRTDSQIYRMFYLVYGIDVLGAQALGARDATELQGRIQTKLDETGVKLALTQ